MDRHAANAARDDGERAVIASEQGERGNPYNNAVCDDRMCALS